MTNLSNLIMSQQPLETGAWARYPYDEKIAAKYRLVDRFDNPYLLYKAQNGNLFLPRGLCPIGEKDSRVRGQDIDYDLLYEPKSAEQDRVICEAYEFLQKGQSGIIQAPTGFGKTYCAYALIAMMRRPVLIVTTKDDLFEMWISEANKFLGLPFNKIGRIRGDTCDVVGKPVTVGMIHSLAKEGKYPDWIRKQFALVIFDETHRLGADEFSKVAGMFASMWRLGLSATPDRADGREIVFHAHIGPVRVTTDAIPMIPKVIRYRTTFKVPMVYRTVNGKKRIIQMPHQAGRIAGVVSIMAQDEERNKLLAKLGYMAYKHGRRTVLFSDQREHLDAIYSRLLALGIRQNDIGYYVGGLKKHEKEEAKKRPFLLATYGFMGEGSDVPTLDTAILGTPRSDVRQIVGRVIRYLPGKEQPLVFDVIDADSHVFQGYADKRARFYQSVGAEVVDG